MVVHDFRFTDLDELVQAYLRSQYASPMNNA